MKREDDGNVMFCLRLLTPFHPEAIYLSHTLTQREREKLLELPVITKFSCEEFNWKNKNRTFVLNPV